MKSYKAYLSEYCFILLYIYIYLLHVAFRISFSVYFKIVQNKPNSL